MLAGAPSLSLGSLQGQSGDFDFHLVSLQRGESQSPHRFSYAQGRLYPPKAGG
jgi:hypothetical protein